MFWYYRGFNYVFNLHWVLHNDKVKTEPQKCRFIEKKNKNEMSHVSRCADLWKHLLPWVFLTMTRQSLHFTSKSLDGDCWCCTKPFSGLSWDVQYGSSHSCEFVCHAILIVSELCRQVLWPHLIQSTLSSVWPSVERLSKSRPTNLIYQS